LVDVQPLNPGVLEDTLDAEYLVIREEHCMAAPFPGRLEVLAKEGEKVPKGAVVAYLYKTEGTSLEGTSKVPLQAPAAGIFSLQVDGLESICNPETWSQIDVQKLAQLEEGLGKKEHGNASDKNLVAAGVPIYKIVDNLSPSYLFLETDHSLSEWLEKGNSVEVRVPELTDKTLKGSVEDLYQEGGKSRLLIRIPVVNNLEKMRRVSGKLILTKYEGIVIPAKMLVTKEGQTGVYLWQNGRARWQEVKVLGEVDKKVAVSGLQQGQWIITTPTLIKEGQRVITRR